MPAADGDLEGGRAWRGVATPPHDGGFTWLTMMGFWFLTLNTAMAIYSSQGDPWAIAFVAFSYLDLLLLFYCLQLFGPVHDPNSWRVRCVKASVRVLTALLTVMFSLKVAAVMPLALAIMVWALAGSTVIGGFYAFFVHRDATAGSHPARA
ncbi:uncharacterized protein LOC133917415 [Phragmites australis]|uniref:uncharacterized protein LOC133917415 n=1 Tax=Phragmites australis TaxID=29695 RepID=UPI002D7979E4|nr:uncharacterized protein LOC133917415 [Phragmites australis]